MPQSCYTSRLARLAFHPVRSLTFRSCLASSSQPSALPLSRSVHLLPRNPHPSRSNPCHSACGSISTPSQKPTPRCLRSRFGFSLCRARQSRRMATRRRKHFSVCACAVSPTCITKCSSVFFSTTCPICSPSSAHGAKLAKSASAPHYRAAAPVCPRMKASSFRSKERTTWTSKSPATAAASAGHLRVH